MIDTLWIITLFLLASLLVCLPTLRLSINVKHLCLFFHSLPILTDFLKLHTPPFIKYNKNLRTPIYFDAPPPLIKHLRVHIILLKNFQQIFDVF